MRERKKEREEGGEEEVERQEGIEKQGGVANPPNSLRAGEPHARQHVSRCSRGIVDGKRDGGEDEDEEEDEDRDDTKKALVHEAGVHADEDEEEGGAERTVRHVLQAQAAHEYEIHQRQ